jgi:FKBP-type peptidyl-prolyl cis-trans isomerase SlyD
MKITDNKVATLTYTLKDDDGQVLDQADKENPFLYMHGTGGIIKGLETALAEKSVDDSFNLIVAPEDAYGIRDDSLTESVQRDMFEGIPDEELIAGAQFHAQTAHGTQVITIAGVEGDTIKIDANHPLAGQTLHFDVAVVDIREATEEEIAHGHPHAPGGCGSHAAEEEKSDSCCGGGCGS